MPQPRLHFLPLLEDREGSFCAFSILISACRGPGQNDASYECIVVRYFLIGKLRFIIVEPAELQEYSSPCLPKSSLSKTIRNVSMPSRRGSARFIFGCNRTSTPPKSCCRCNPGAAARRYRCAATPAGPRHPATAPRSIVPTARYTDARPGPHRK